MANSVVQLPYTNTTSGQLLDSEQLTVGANTVERERVQITGTAAAQIAQVTSSYGLRVDITSTAALPMVSASSGLVQISGSPTVLTASSGYLVRSLSSGTVTLSSQHTVDVSSGIITLSSNPVTGQVVSLSSGTVTLSSDPTVVLSSNPVAGQVVSLSSGTVTLSSAVTVDGITNIVSNRQQTASGSGMVPATSSEGLLVNTLRGTTMGFANIRATSSGLGELVASSGSNKIKVTSYTIVCNSTNEVAFYSSGSALAASSSAPMVLSSYSGIAIAGDRGAWLLETSAGGNLQIYLGNAGIVSGHLAYFYEV